MSSVVKNTSQIETHSDKMGKHNLLDKFPLAKIAKTGYNDFSERSVIIMTMATATEVQNNFGRFLKVAQEGGEVIILKNGVEVARLVSREKTMSFLSDSLVGVLSGDVDEKAVKRERMERYESPR